VTSAWDCSCGQSDSETVRHLQTDASVMSVNHATDMPTDRVVEIDVGAYGSLLNLHHWPIVVAHCYLRVARVSLHNFTHCFHLHAHTHACAVLAQLSILALRFLSASLSVRLA